MRKLITSEFIEKANKVHNYRYDYTSTDYKLSSLPVTITCIKHGDFVMDANAHTQGQGCTKCGKISAGNKRRKDPNQFVKEARKIHGNKYAYDKVVYKNTHTPVIITCPKHGDFEQKPNCHLSQRNGCQRCGYDNHNGRYMSWHFKTKEQKSKPGIFYVLKFVGHGEEFIKIGITSKKVSERYYGRKFGYQMKILHQQSTTLHKAFLKEEQLKKLLKQYQFSPKRLREGRTECYSVVGLRKLGIGI